MTSAKALIEKVLKASRIGVKTVWVGRSGSILATFYSLDAAREAAVLFGSFATHLKVAEGYDDDAADHRNYRKVYRVAGLMGV
jgi:hypothetical protein